MKPLRFYLKAITLLFMFMESTVMLWAQVVNEKFAWTTQVFLNELNEQVTQPSKGSHRVPRHQMPEELRMLKPQRLIATPDTVGGMAYISCFIHLKDVNNLNAMRSLGVEVEETFDELDFVTAKVPVKQLEKLADIDNVTRIKVAEVMRPLTDVARQKTNVDDLLKLSTDATTAGITTKYDGTGVVLGVIDNGIDFQHIAFKDKNGNSRIKRAYVYDGSSEYEYTTITSTSPTTDDEAADHGTHCASTAGGSSVIVSGTNVTVTDNHTNATYGGMAPGADLYLAGVKGLSNTYLANALKKMVTYADAQGKPLVVSNSWGSHWGPHNGTGEWADLVGQYFGESHPGHIILFASSNDAGHSKDNEGGGFFVKKSSASSSNPLGTILRSNTYPNADAGLYYPGNISMAFSTTQLNCKIHVLNNSTGAIIKSWTVTSNSSSFSGLDTYYSGTLNIIKGWWDNDNYCIYAYTNDGLIAQNYTTSTQNGETYFKSAYTLAIEIYPASGSTSINMSGMGNYTYFTNHLTTSGHTWTAGTDDMCVSDQATIPNAISVGAYMSKTSWKNYENSTYSYSTSNSLGDIASFSSYATAAQSPTGLAYPWITAPGAMVVAGVNHYHTTTVDETNSYYGSGMKGLLMVNNSNNPYGAMEGTSMATPVVAGIVAQWLQAAKSVNKSLTVNDVKTIMAQTAITDNYTSGTNASHFGKGKIDALAGIQYILGTPVEPNTVTIDAGANNTDYIVPYGNYYKYSTTQMLYTPAEIGRGGKINSIAFKVASSTSLTTSEVNVYLGHKSGTFSSTSDYVTSSNLTLVYSGSPTLGQTTGWETLTFNQGTFTYNGMDNLVVVVTRKSDNYKSGLKYYYYNGDDSYTLYRRSDSNTGYGDVTNTSYNYSTSTNRPAIQMVFEESSLLKPGTWSGSTLTIDAEADSIGYNVPYSNFYQYSTTQMLYTPAEIGKGGKISSIAFKIANSTSHTTSEVKVYMGHKSSIFSSASDYVTSNNLTLVYSGSPTLGQTTGWETLKFNQGTFTYNGTDNLVVVVTRKSDNYKSGLKYYYYYSGNGYTLYRRSDSNTGYGDVTNTSYNYSASTNRPAVRMVFGELTPEPGIAINATNFPDENFRTWLLGQLYGADGVLTDEEISAVTDIDVHGNNIQNLKGIELFTALTVLYCYENQLTTLDVSKNTALTTLGCSANQLDAIDVSKNTELSWFNCGSNRLATLDISKNTKLLYLQCYENQLVSLDLSNNTALKELRCQNNPLQELDVLQNAALTYLGCNDNQLTMLDISNNTALTHLYCYDNQLTMLDVSKNTALNVISCYNNLLTELDVSGCSALTLLAFFQNQVKDASMDALVESLPVVSNSNLYVIYNENEHNVMDTEQVASAKSKGWTPLYYDGSNWLEYEGSEPTPALELTLIDSEDYSNIRNRDVETLHYSRFFEDTDWQAWYVPFDLTINSVIMEHYAFAKFAGTYTEEDGNFYIAIMRLKEGDVVKANTPYCVQARVADSANPQVITQTDVLLKAAEENSFYMLSAEKKITLWGNYMHRSVVTGDGDVYAMSNGKYSKQQAGNTLAPFRCFFTLENREDNPYASTSNPSEVKLMVLGDDEYETGIVEVENGEMKFENSEWFDLSGRKLDKPQRGINIIRMSDGSTRKTMIK